MKHKMSKHLRGVMLVLAVSMAIMMAMSLTVFASSGHTHDNITFVEWTSTNGLPTEPGNYYLAGDVTLPNGAGYYAWTAPQGTVNLCLNGKQITSDMYWETIVRVPKNATLNLYDEAGNAGKIIDQSEHNNQGVHVEGTCHMYGGSITGNQTDNSNGAGIYMRNNGKITLAGDLRNSDPIGVYMGSPDGVLKETDSSQRNCEPDPW